MTGLCSALLLAGGGVSPAAASDVGVNDFPVSQAGAAFDATDPSVAYNPAADEYLVVWEGEKDVDGEVEIYGQRLNASGAEVVTDDFRISDMGPDGDTAFSARKPAVVYNPDAAEYLVVWQGVDAANDGTEIFIQRLTGATADPAGPNDFRISDMGTAGSVNDLAVDPALAYNAASKEYLVVWSASDRSNPALAPGEPEIYGQRLDAAGAELGADDFRISTVGPDGDANHHGSTPAVAWGSGANQYLVVWNGDEIDDDNEIYGQLLTAAGDEVGADDFRISQSGPDGDINWIGALDPAIAYNATNDEFLVVWHGDDPVIGDVEIRAQRLSAAGAELGTDDFPLSDMDFTTAPAVVWTGAAANDYVVVWEGSDGGEEEIFGQRLAGPSAAQVGTDDFRLSDMEFNAHDPAATHNVNHAEHLVVWGGEDDETPPLAAGDFEVFGQRFNDEPTAVTVTRLAARVVPGGIELRWRTASELAVLGFHVTRTAGPAPRGKADSVLLAARARGGGASYRWVDRSARTPGRYRYRLEAVRLDGARSLAAAVTVVRAR
ncbi:MAG: hypothetical protein ABR521_00135 [Gaiellaceae bacterium]